MPTKYEAQARYDAANTVKVTMKLHKRNDADILEALDGKAKQTECKRLIRKGLQAEREGRTE